MPMIPPTNITPAEPQASLAAEEQFLALEARAERDGYAAVTLKGEKIPLLAFYHGDGKRVRLRYRLEQGRHGTRWLTRAEALRLLTEVA